MREKRLVILGPNAALQKTLEFKSGWVRGEVNRASQVKESVGGKGQQFSRALVSWLKQYPCSEGAEGNGREIKATLLQFLGGTNGQAIETLLGASGISNTSDPVHCETVWLPYSNTRTCITVLDSEDQTATELIEPSDEIPKECLDSMLLKVNKYANADAVALCGTMPPGAEDLFQYAAASVSKSGGIVWLDGFKNIESTLPFVSILKVNLSELRAISGKKDPQDASQSLFAQYSKLDGVCATDGGKPAHVMLRNGEHYVLKMTRQIPAESFCNPIGAGDTVGAVTLCNLLQGDSLVHAFAKGLAAGSASCLQVGGADFVRSEVDSFLASVEIQQQQP